MFDLKMTFQDLTDAVKRSAERAQFEKFNQAAFGVMQTARESIKRAEGPSEEGQPPHTHRGVFLRRAIRYAADRDGATIGPIASIVGEVGSAHEFGGRYRDTWFPERPFMGPALDKNLDRFANSWGGSIGV